MAGVGHNHLHLADTKGGQVPGKAAEWGEREGSPQALMEAVGAGKLGAGS